MVTRPHHGEVWWVEAPEIPRRPALILTRDDAIPVLDRLTVVTATTRIRDIPTEVELGPEEGMPRRCVLTLDNVERVPQGYLKDRITRLSPPRMDEVCRALSIATGC